MSIIVHDGAGRGGVGRRLTEVLGHLDTRGLEYEVLHTSYAGHATELARDALDRGSRFLVACGGDGTIHEVVNGMIAGDKPVNPEAVFGIVSAGTGSDFIKTFGLPAQPSYAAAHLDGPESFPIDIGKITFAEGSETRVRYFPNIAEVGFGAKVVQRAAKLPRWLGPTIYFFAFWLCLPRHKQVKATVDLVDRTYDGPVDNLIVANCQFFGGGMQIAPKAAPTDGLLDVQINHVGKKEAIALLPRIYKGQHIPHPLIEEAKRAKLSIQTEDPIPIEADGEVLGHTPATFEVIRDVIRLKV
jgi:YegS/Rv2252/BmrU family lipid kinase